MPAVPSHPIPAEPTSILETRQRWRDRVRLYGVPTLMLIVAAVHTYQWRTLQRSSWGSGCAFGMFSTVDYHGTRWVKVFETSDGQRRELSITEPEFEDALFRIRVLPNSNNIDRLATKLRSHLWFQSNDGTLHHFRAEAIESLASVEQESTERELVDLEFEVWGIQVRAPRRRIIAHLIRKQEDLSMKTQLVLTSSAQGIR